MRADRQDNDPELDAAAEELVAETVAYSVCASSGIEPGEFSITYLASWSERTPIATIERTAAPIDRLSRRIEDAVATVTLADSEGRRRCLIDRPRAGCRRALTWRRQRLGRAGQDERRHDVRVGLVPHVAGMSGAAGLHGWRVLHRVAAVDPRLRPLNAVLALVHPDGAWFHDLAEQGLRLHSIELKVQSSAGIVVADAVLYRLDPDLVLLCEGKSGRNVEEEQARKYAMADAAALRRGGSLPVDVAHDAPVAPLYVVMNDVRSDVEAALQGWGIEAPVLSIDRGFARLDGPCPEGVEPFVRDDARRRWPPGRIRVDHQSPLEEVAELLAQQIGAAQAKREPVLDLAEAASRIYRLWPQLSQSGRRESYGS